MRLLRAAVFWLPLGLLWILAGCASTGLGLTATELQERPAVELTDVPFYPQERHQCGPAALAMMLDWNGAGIGPEALTERLYVPARQGSLQPELTAQARQQGQLVYRIPNQPKALLDEVAAGHPVLVLQNLGLGWWPVWHYAVVIGYEPDTRSLLLRSGTTQRHKVTLSTFLHTWARGENWGIVILNPGNMPASAQPGPYLAAAYDLEAAGLQQQAMRAYSAGIERWPEHAGLRLALANGYYADGQIEQAVAALQQGLRAGAIAAANYNNLAWLLAKLQQWDAAEAAAREAVRLGDENLERYQTTLEKVCRQRPDGC